MTQTPGSSPGTSAGSTDPTGTTNLNDGPGTTDASRELLYGGRATPADGSATADTDHPGLGADGLQGDDAGSLSTGDVPLGPPPGTPA
jgi:hypothetical protein